MNPNIFTLYLCNFFFSSLILYLSLTIKCIVKITYKKKRRLTTNKNMGPIKNIHIIPKDIFSQSQIECITFLSCFLFLFKKFSISKIYIHFITK